MSKLGRNLLFPLVELLRPIPPLAWVPIAVLIFAGTETPVIFVTMLASFFATVLNTYLGVRSIDENYFRAASCLGYSKRAVLFRVVVPGALPFIFTGMQIAMGRRLVFACWRRTHRWTRRPRLHDLRRLHPGGHSQHLHWHDHARRPRLSSAMIRAVGQFLMRWQQKSRGEA
ncbi:ABC transporter permease [Chenggangzhangella methanolivorans]|uniref:ABC transporter permease subunit n=1 Tax=Chenggangzhangella methanolivorans TaxID=1437009 RepID=A0A9E6UNY4_9HYPH|nr:ABC transporter permease subunit [Chenggangzhangella methanolivorans]QZN99119.1 ABC transporter permease subunit [Chenggangzhangella methanolivorans]